MPAQISIRQAIYDRIVGHSPIDDTTLPISNFSIPELALYIDGDHSVEMKINHIATVGGLIHDPEYTAAAQFALLSILENQDLQQSLHIEAASHLATTDPDQLIAQAHRPLAAIATGEHPKFRNKRFQSNRILIIIIGGLLSRVAQHNEEFRSFLSENITALSD